MSLLFDEINPDIGSHGRQICPEGHSGSPTIPRRGVTLTSLPSTPKRLSLGDTHRTAFRGWAPTVGQTRDDVRRPPFELRGEVQYTQASSQ